VDHIKRAVRSVGELSGAEPVVGRGQKLLIGFYPFSARSKPAVDDARMIHQVVRDLADEQRTAIPWRKSIAAVDGDAGRPGEVAGHLARFRGAWDDSFEAQARADDAPRLVRADA